jgi:hypothetical protein
MTPEVFRTRLSLTAPQLRANPFRRHRVVDSLIPFAIPAATASPVTDFHERDGFYQSRETHTDHFHATGR